MARPKKYKTETERLQVRRQRERNKRANETPLERDRRLMRLSLNELKRRRSETADERIERLKRMSVNARKRRAKETEDERKERLRKLSESEMRRRAREKDQKRTQNGKNKRTSESNCHNIQRGKMARGRKQNSNGIKIDLINCFDDQGNQYLEQMQHDPGKFAALIKKSGLNSIPNSQLRCVETRKLQKVSVGNGANRKQKTKTTTRARQNRLIPVCSSNEANSKLYKTSTNSMFHSVSTEILLHPQSTVSPVQEKRILVVPNHQVAVMSNLFSMWKAGRLCDSYISNGTTSIMVHKMVLGAVCPKLMPALHLSSKSSFPKVTFPGSVSEEALLAFAEYMYSGVLNLNEDILVQLKTIAEKLEMKDFEELCAKELKKAKAKDIFSAVVEPLLAEPCSLSGLLPSRTQGESNDVQDSILMKFLRNNYSNNNNNNNNMQPDVAVSIASTSRSSTSSDVRSVENMFTDQIVVMKTEVEPEIDPATNQNSLQLKLEPCSPGESQYNIQEDLFMDINNINSNNNLHLTPAASATHGNIINKDNDLTVTYSNHQYRNDLNMDSNDIINISDIHRSEEICLSQYTEDCDKDTDNQKELQLISVISATGNISEDGFINNSDVIEISSTIPINTEPPNSRPYPVSLFSVNRGYNETL